MIKKLTGILAACAVLGLSSCNDDNPWIGSAGHGAISLSVMADGQITDAVPQTRAWNDELQVPEVSDFSILLEKQDGSMQPKVYPTLADFQKEESFPTGLYTITAFYGDKDKEGFDCPYFEGSTEVTVLEGREAKASVVASVAHTLVSVEYTEGFKSFLHDYKAQVHSEGHTYVDIEADQDAPAFIKPGKVTLSVTFSNQQNQTLTLEPAEFEALAAHHYHFTLDVNEGNNGVAQLSVKFDPSLEQEEVTIDLTQELFTSQPPKVNPVGFTHEQELEFLAGEAPSGKFRYDVISHGGLKEVVLTIASSNYTPKFGNEINLIQATPEQQQQLADLGIECKGIFKNPDRMAIVDISNLAKNLPAGNYEVTLKAKDNFTRISEPVTLKIVSVATTLTAEGLTALAGLNEGTVAVSYNGTHPETDITFEAKDRLGNWVPAKVLNCDEATRTRSFDMKSYIFNIQLPDTDRNPMQVRVYLRGLYITTVELPVEEPQYSLRYDAFAGKVWVKVDASEGQTALIADNINIFENGAKIAESRIEREAATGDIFIKGLSADTSYTLAFSLTGSVNNASKSITFTTEQAKALDNGNFSSTETGIDVKNLNTGAIYTCALARNQYNTADVYADIPTKSSGWATLNDLTFYTGSQVQNTWFMIPSTYVENGEAKIRSVGYSHNGVLPGGVSQGGLSTKYYNHLAPEESTFTKTSGELFLGSYSYINSAASRIDGISFGSRPASVSFDYSYAPVNSSEVGVVYVSLLDAANTVIGSASADLSSTSKTSVTVAIPEYKFGMKAATLRLQFKSTKGDNIVINIPSGDDLAVNRVADNSSLNAHVSPADPTKSFHVPANLYKAKATGSELSVSNVKLNY